MLYSGEFHPFRQPVPGLWLDTLQKLKGSGFNCVSMYTHWGLLEADKGQIITDGIWDLESFFNAASEAGHARSLHQRGVYCRRITRMGFEIAVYSPHRLP